jgi:hypothetical protein
MNQVIAAADTGISIEAVGIAIQTLDCSKFIGKFTEVHSIHRNLQ